MNKQIRSCHFLISTTDGNTTTEVYNATVDIYSGSYDYVPYFHTSAPFDESIGGKLRSQFAGWRFEGSLAWNRLINATPFFAVLDNIGETTANFTQVIFAPDATNVANNVEVIVVPSRLTTTIEGTMINQPLAVQVLGRDVEQALPGWFQL